MFRTGLWLMLPATIACASLAVADNWADQTDYPDLAESKAMCRAVRNLQVPAADRPTAKVIATLKGCDAEALYYGIGMKADPVRARQCALKQSDDPDRAILMTVYANGAGVPRNIDLAINLACNMDSAPAEYHGRIGHLAGLKIHGPQAKPFDVCDDITSGLAAGYCVGREDRLADVKRSRELAKLIAGWSAADKAALATLQAAQKGFTDLRSTEEVDLSGTLRATFIMDEEQEQANDFLAMLRQISAGKAPTYGLAQARAADAQLNAAFQQLQRANVTDSWGTITKDGIRKTERAWLAYRDAWIAFAKLKYPQVPTESLVAWLTKKRVVMLQELNPKF